MSPKGVGIFSHGARRNIDYTSGGGEMSCPVVLVFLALPVAYAVFRWLFPVDDVPNSDKPKQSKVDIVMDNIINRRTVTPKDCNGKAGLHFFSTKQN